MASVAREAGVGKAALSRRFATREELITAITAITAAFRGPHGRLRRRRRHRGPRRPRPRPLGRLLPLADTPTPTSLYRSMVRLGRPLPGRRP
ncbi:TetR family transcriptional regulator [Streptomyces sp. NPDC005811]|uniref:TetR family transcriptional regulator n=1 Tax=Streptomyces sp. NPDC005811 TaxID=3154565 RepID=UPI0034034A0B